MNAAISRFFFCCTCFSGLLRKLRNEKNARASRSGGFLLLTRVAGRAVGPDDDLNHFYD